MKLFTKEIDKKLFEQYSKGNDLENQMVVAKIFNPYGRGTWYLLNSDPEDPDYIWAIVNLFEVETGSISRNELESIKVPPFRLGLERDLSWTPKPAMEVMKGLQDGKYFAEGGKIKNGDVVEVKEPNYGYDDSYYVVSDKAGYDKDGYLISATQKRVSDVFEESQLKKIYARGGNIKQIKVGEEYRYYGSNSIEKDIMDRIRPQLSGLKFAGNFSVKGWKGVGDGYLYFLDDFDKKLVKDIVINPSERIYRYYTRNSAIGGMIPLIKINLDNGLVYFNEANDFGDESIIFSTKGQKSEYINLVKATDEDYYAEGGSIEDENREMVLNENKQIKHHTEELPNAIKGKKVPAWVVAKVHESASDLSDATHYMDGEKMANGGGVDYLPKYELDEEGNFSATINGKKYKIIYRDDISQMYDLFENGVKIASDRNLRNLMSYEKYAKGGGVHTMPNGEVMLNSAHYDNGGAIEDNTAIFDRLKKGNKIHITYGSAIYNKGEKTLLVKSKNLVGKGKSYESEKITFENVENPSGVKYYAYKRKNDKVGFAVGDMAIFNVVITMDNKMANGGQTTPKKTFTKAELEKNGYSLVKTLPSLGAMMGMPTLKQQQDLEADGLNLKNIMFFAMKDGKVGVGEKKSRSTMAKGGGVGEESGWKHKRKK